MAKVVTPKNFKSYGPKVVKPTSNFRISEEYLEKEAQKRAEAEEKKRQQAAYEAITAPVKNTNPLSPVLYKEAKETAKKSAEEAEKYNAVVQKDLGVYNAEIDELEKRLKEAKALKNKGGYEKTDRGYIYKSAQQEYLDLYNYKNLEALEDALTTLKTNKRMSEIHTKLKTLSAVGDASSKSYDPQFERYSTVNKKYANDDVYKYINDIDGNRTKVEENFEKNAVRVDGNGNAWKNPEPIALQNNYKYMTEQEIAIYNYYYAKQGKTKANEYLKALERELNIRSAMKISGSYNTTGDKIAYGLVAGLDQFEQGMSNLFNTSDEYIEPTDTQIASGMIREDLADSGAKLPKWMGGASLGQAAYDIVNTSANMLPSILTASVANMLVPGSGSIVGAGLMGASASGNAYQEMLNLGYDKNQARTYSVLVGASEAALSAAFSGIDKLGGNVTSKFLKNVVSGIDNGLARFAVTWGGKMLSEGFEESMQETLTPLFENIALGYGKNDFSDINWSEVVYSGLLGMVSAAPFSAVEAAGSVREKNYSAETPFAKQVDDVINGTHDVNYDLYVSKTPKIFTDLGFSDAPLLMRNSKISEILEKHPEMSVDTIKQIPNALQNPILILKSKTHPTESVVAITDIETDKGNMVVPVWVNQQGNYIDIDLGEGIKKEANFVASAYGRNLKTILEYANENDGFLYQNSDIEKVRQLLTQYGLQLPTPLKLSDSNITIPQEKGDVNTNISTKAENNTDMKKYWADVIEQQRSAEAQLDAENPVLQSSAKESGIVNAVEGQNDGTEQNEVLSEDEVDGEGSVFTNSKPADIHREPTKEQIFKTVNGKPINDIQKQIEAVCEKFGIKLIWSNNVKRGKYRPADNVILMNPNQELSWMYAQIFKHEFLHYLKYRKGFEKFKKEVFENSTVFVEYVRGRLKKLNGVEFEGSDQEAIATFTKFKFDEYRNSDELTEIVRRQFTMEDAEEEALADFVGDMLFGSLDFDESMKKLQKLSLEAPSVINRIREWLKSLIERLRGEKQNKDVCNDIVRLDKMLERVLQSKELDRTDGVEKNSIVESFVDENGKRYDNAILLDTNFFDGLSPINWGGKLKKYVESRSKNNPVIMPIIDEEGQEQNLVFAKTSDRTSKNDGSEHRVLDELIRTKDNISKLSVIHIDEIIEVSEENNPYYSSENLHGWLDKNGWLHRNANVINAKNGNIHNVTVDIAKAKDGRIILYATKGKIKKVGQAKVNSLKIKGSTPHSNYNHNIQQNNGVVNEKNSITTPNKVDTAKLAKRILRQNKSGYDAGELKGKLDYIFSLMSESNWGMAYEQALDVSRMIFEMSKLGVEITDDAVEVLRLIRTTPVRLDSVQKAEAAISYGSYNNFRKRNMGRISIKNDAIPLETAWSEWSSEYPDLFDENLNPADMPNALSTIIDNLKSQHVDFDTESAIQWLASRILNDAANEMYNPLSKQLQEAVAETEKIYEKQHIEDVRFMAQQKAKIERLKTELKRRRSEIAEEITAQREERATKQKNIEHIRKVVAQIDRKLRTNSVTDHIPEKLKAPMIDFVKLFIKNDTSPFDKKKVSYLASVYENSLLKADEGLLLDDSIAEDLDTLAETLDGKTLRNLSYYETLLVRQIVDHFAHVIGMEEEIFIADKKVELDQIGNKALEEITANKPKRTNKLIDGIDGVKYANMTPIYFFNRLGGTFKKLFDDILSGQDKCYRNWEVSKTYISEIKEKYHYNDWDTTEKFKLKTTLGETIEITREQAMLLYATAKREYGNEFQKSEHLFKGGIVIEPSQKALKEAVKELQKEGANSKNIIKAFSQEIDSKRHRITPIDAGEIKNWLTDEQKAYADGMVEYLSKDMAALGNEVSMKLYGINKFNEDYYIPYNSAANYLYSQPGVTNDARLKHQSFTKETVKGANTPLVLSDFSSVCADHINRMCMYNAMTIPLENLTRIFNYQKFSLDENGNKTLSTDMKVEIERAFGSDAVDYILQFLNDMNGNVRISSADKFINRLISKFKKGAVFASASVVIQQPSAIMRAMAYINPKYFASTTFSFAERNYQEAINYAPVAGVKEMGRFDTGVGAATTNWLLHQIPKGAKNKVKEFFSKDSIYRDDKLSYFAAKADEITWAHIWAAVKAEMKEKTNLEPNSQEFLEACGKRFTEVINYTQVYDSTLSRSQLMRDKSTGAQMITAFMSEPTVSLNLLMNAVHEAKKGTKAGAKYAAAAVGGYVGSVMLNAILKSLVTAGRDDDEEKSYWEKYFANVGGNIISDLNPMNLIPVLKDIISIFEGYTVERADMSLFSDLAQSVNVISNDDKTIYEKIESISGSIAAFFGLPVKNVLRDCRAAYNVYKDFFKNDNKTTSEGVKYSFFEEITGKDSNKHYYGQMMKAVDNGDYKRYNEIFNYLKEKGVEEKTIYTGIKSAYKQSKETEKEVEKQISAISNNDTYKSFNGEEKEKVENTIKTVVATQKMLEDTLKKHYDDFDKLYEYKRKSNTKGRERIINELKAKGLTEKQISDGETIAKYAYLKSIGIDLATYATAQIAVNTDNADLDKSGGVSKLEKRKAINNMDVDDKTKSALRKFYN